MGKTESLLKLRGIMDCMKKQTIYTHCAYKYRTMIFFVSNYICTIIPNDKIWYLKQVKDEPPCNPSTVFRVRVRALFEWQNRSKVAVAFVFALDAFALCINGPLLYIATDELKPSKQNPPLFSFRLLRAIILICYIMAISKPSLTHAYRSSFAPRSVASVHEILSNPLERYL